MRTRSVAETAVADRAKSRSGPSSQVLAGTESPQQRVAAAGELGLLQVRLTADLWASPAAAHPEQTRPTG